MMADTVEAAVRSLQNPTPHRIEDEVRKLVHDKYFSGQLDDSDLTLKDMEKCVDAFTKVLMSMYHTRIAYPDAEEIKKKEQQKSESNGHNGK